MQVLCKASNAASDVRCSVCGQGFLVYWVRTAADLRGAMRTEIAGMLRGHHDGAGGAEVHPAGEFHLPVWHGDGAFSAAALMGAAALIEV